MTHARSRHVTSWLTAQAVAFGATMALLLVAGNTLFLDAYGAAWLPATYIAIALFGTAASALVARAARRTTLVRVATATLLALAAVYAASWVVLRGGGLWISAVLLVVLAVAIQLGFVFIGGQAGRLLDVRQMKERFPRVLAGFSVGFLLGGLVALPLLTLLGSTEDLLLGTTAAQLAFLGLLLATERRFPEVDSGAPARATDAPRPSARTLFASGIVLLLLVYQVLSAMGGWVVEYLFFDRAHAQYSGEDLTRFLAVYTVLLNLAAILFLWLVAGRLVRRFGLRLGFLLNPLVVAGLLFAIAGMIVGNGAAAYGVFALAAVARVADIVLNDGITRTSVNAAFQLVPIRERLAVQTVVEGSGVPIAVGATGALLLLVNLAGLGIGAVVALGLFLGVLWTASAIALDRAYRRVLSEQMRHIPLGASEAALAQDDAALLTLLRSEDARDVRLGLDLLPGVVSTASTDALWHAAEHADSEVRVRALITLADGGDATAGRAVTTLAHELALSSDATDRCAAAAAMGSSVLATGDRNVLVRLLDDPDPAVRASALDAVLPEDAREEAILERVVAAVEQPRTTGSAAAALRRLGSAAVPLVAARLAREPAARRPALIRVAASAAKEHGLQVLEPALRDGDRVVVLWALEALESVDGGGTVGGELFATLFDDAAAHAARTLAARTSPAARSAVLRRALEDETDLARRLVIGVLALRHGAGVRDAVRVVDGTEGQRRALGIEALDVLLSRQEAAVAIPLVRRDLAVEQQAAALKHLQPGSPPENDVIVDLAADPDGVWRSPWLALCARDASGA